MKSTYNHSNNNNNNIKSTRAGRIALAIMQDAHPDLCLRMSSVRAHVCAIIFKCPKLNDAGVTRKYYYHLMNDMFAASI